MGIPAILLYKDSILLVSQQPYCTGQVPYVYPSSPIVQGQYPIDIPSSPGGQRQYTMCIPAALLYKDSSLWLSEQP